MILVWEDDEDIQELLSYNLLRAGYEVEIITEEEAFVSRALSSSAKLIIIGANANEQGCQRVYNLLVKEERALYANIICLVSTDSRCPVNVPVSRKNRDSCIPIPVKPSMLMKLIEKAYQAGYRA